jgi:cytochrome P450
VVNVIAHALYFVAEQPELLRDLQQEVDAVLGPADDGAGGAGGAGDARVAAAAAQAPSLDYGKAKRLVLCEMVLRESLRLLPPANIIARQLERPVTVHTGPGPFQRAATAGGVTLEIPAGTEVLLPVQAIQTAEWVWGKDADQFRPRRWETPLPGRGAFLPFSDGPRNCVGEHFAMLEGVAALAALVQRFTFQPAPGFKRSVIFTGFGLRPFDLETQQCCMRMVLAPR